MTLETKHQFVSEIDDGTDDTVVKPSDWNANHVITLSEEGVVGRLPGDGAGVAGIVPWSRFLPAGIGPLPFAGTEDKVPTGWLICYGQKVLKADYPRLYAAIGDAYNTGGELGTEFRVPDCRDRTLIGRGTMGGGAAVNRITVAKSGLDTSVAGNAGGVESKTPTVHVTATATGTLTVSGDSDNIPLNGSANSGGGSSFPIVNSGDKVHLTNLPVSGSLSIDTTPSVNEFSIVQPSLVVNFIISV